MTLIACLHPRQCRTLLADILISSKIPNDGDFVPPTRVYIQPERLRGMSWKPAAFRRKVIEVTPELVILWAGKYDEACRLARHSKEWFRTDPPTCDSVRQLLEAHYPVSTPHFSAIIASATEK